MLSLLIVNRMIDQGWNVTTSCMKFSLTWAYMIDIELHNFVRELDKLNKRGFQGIIGICNS